jgi:hypothetical protein
MLLVVIQVAAAALLALFMKKCVRGIPNFWVILLVLCSFVPAFGIILDAVCLILLVVMAFVSDEDDSIRLKKNRFNRFLFGRWDEDND